MKIKKYLLHIGLIIAVGVSLVFSAIIWLDPVTFHHNTTQTTTTNDLDNITKSDNNYKWSDVYLPTKVILTKDKQQMQLTSDKEDLVGDIRNSIKKVHVKDITGDTKEDFAAYRSELLKNNSIMLSYSGPVSIGLFEKMMDQHILLKKYANKTFKHIVIPLDDHKTIYLFNDSNLKVYKVELLNDLPNSLYKVVDNKNVQQTLVQYQEISKNNYILNYTKGVKVSQYSYLINKENTNLFMTRLLGSSNSNSISTKEHDEITTYTTNSGQRLVIDGKTGMVTYSRDARQKKHSTDSSFNDILKESFNDLNRLGANLDDVRYQGYDSNSKKVTYQSYVNGYPIISNNYNGTYEISIQKNGAMQYQFSTDNLQVPLSNNAQTVDLPSTNDVIQTLKDNNYNINKVKDIVVGYEWKQNDNSQMVVDLIPTYFVHYNDIWINYKDLGKEN
ncbi:YycH family regulatory protein [Ligilactobacillus cholophilus]|uniref:YycH family regulatory protein n=1 Tax=Ligilactobacillus cholophilus TaxID=3050131 RepID=UPI0025B02B27|nr:two-component system activity regulator YycH [Ligilactobacillus cholophilus]